MSTGAAILQDAIARIAAGESLSRDQAAQVMELIMEGEATGAQFGALMMGLYMKGETVEEIAGLASVMREKAIPVHVDGEAVDTCGTGGDRSGTFNISTTAAFVAAAAGATVAKHGNRAMSSACGSADVLEALGAEVELDAPRVELTIRESGMGFMFAPMFHPAMRHAAGPRREMRVRTVFNILGPLTNPAGARRQVLGVSDSQLAPKLIQVLRELGSTHALVVHGEDGLDELTLSGPSQVHELRDGEIGSYQVTPSDFGLEPASVRELAGGDAAENAGITRAVLVGQPGPRRDVVLLNAAAALVAADLAGDLTEGLERAARAVDSGDALRKLEEFVRSTQAVRA